MFGTASKPKTKDYAKHNLVRKQSGSELIQFRYNLDGISSEHIKYGGTQLLVHLCLLVNAMMKHSFVPADFCFGMIIPLLKDKHGDTSRLDMYRGITVSNHSLTHCCA